MFSKGVPEKLIAEKTGHRSLKALRFYERTAPEMERAVIANPKEQFPFREQAPVVKPEPLEGEECSASKMESSGAASAVPTFSGSLQHCTINIYNK